METFVIAAVALIVALVWPERVLVMLIAVDHLALAFVTLGNCKPGETISAAAWSLHQNGKMQGRVLVPLIDALFFIFESDHCEKSWHAQRHLYK